MYVSMRACGCVCVTAIVDVDRSTVYQVFFGSTVGQPFDLPMRYCFEGQPRAIIMTHRIHGTKGTFTYI